MRSIVAVQTATLAFALLQSSQAQSLNPLSVATPTSSSCGAPFASLAGSTNEDWQPPSNIFGNSLPYLVPSAVGILTLTQVFKHALLGDPNAPVFSEVFPVTIANDTLTTLTSHWIATSKLEGLKRILNGQTRNGEVGFWRRAGANTLLGSALINMTWLAAGMDVGPAQVCGALGLCAVVYPTLQALKTGLYKRLPLRRDVRELTHLEEQYPEEVTALREIALQRSKELGVAPKEAEFLLMTAIDAVVTNQPLEQKMSPELFDAATVRIHELHDGLYQLNVEITGLGADLTSLDATSNSQLRQLIKRQRILRRELINELIALYDKSANDSLERQEILALLSFGDQVDPAFSLALHRSLQRRLRGYQGRLAAASVVDMSVAIGFFGGVCLEATNYWAKTGDLPTILRIVAGT